MSPESQRIAIAEACGWQWIPPFNARKKENHLVPLRGRACTVWRGGGLGGNLPPDYCSDLNAMNEAEKVLKDREWERYAHHLFNITHHEETAMFEEMVRAVAHATAAQRAEAFLRTLGLWKEGE